ncbi:MAG: KEOPS complex subunit Pcc1, partial [Halobacteria archaeon]|nr:KEOPS complex subunit Pcc1 [Halobacteria archaeon]
SGLIYSSISPEVGEVEGRSEANVEYTDGKTKIHVESPDIVALRASVNMWLRLSRTADDARLNSIP